MDQNVNLEDLLAGITPSLVTPHLGEIMAAKSGSRPKQIAAFILKGLVNGQKQIGRAHV